MLRTKVIFMTIQNIPIGRARCGKTALKDIIVTLKSISVRLLGNSLDISEECIEVMAPCEIEKSLFDYVEQLKGA